MIRSSSFTIINNIPRLIIFAQLIAYGTRMYLCLESGEDQVLLRRSRLLSQMTDIEPDPQEIHTLKFYCYYYSISLMYNQSIGEVRWYVVRKSILPRCFLWLKCHLRMCYVFVLGFLLPLKIVIQRQIGSGFISLRTTFSKNNVMERQCNKKPKAFRDTVYENHFPQNSSSVEGLYGAVGSFVDQNRYNSVSSDVFKVTDRAVDDVK